MSYEEKIILYCLYKINGERTIYSILHLLNGKKSSQTIQDIHIFQLTALFQSHPKLTRDKMDQIIQQLLREEWILRESKEFYVINQKRETELEKLWGDHLYPLHLKGWEYHQSTTIFWQRLALFVQVSSHLSERSVKYIPIQRNPNIQMWVKNMLQSFPVNKNQLNSILYKELLSILEESELDPSLLVSRLTGIKKIGLTAEQVADKMNIDPFYYQIHFLALLHFIMDKILENKERYPLLISMVNVGQQTYTLTTSTRKTFEYVKMGLSIEKICEVRRLKRSTIEDHLIEIILNVPEYSVEHLITNDKINRIKKCMQQVSSKSLKVIKEQLVDVSYFEIRVVMARFGDK